MIINPSSKYSVKVALFVLAALPCLGACAPTEICSQANDAGFSGGTLWSASATSPQVRFGNAFSYTRFVPNGLYIVALHFVEPNAAKAGDRLFDVRINDALVYHWLDVFALAGKVGKAIKRSTVAVVTDGTIRIDFASANGRPAVVSAIRITPLGIGIEEAQ